MVVNFHQQPQRAAHNEGAHGGAMDVAGEEDGVRSALVVELTRVGSKGAQGCAKASCKDNWMRVEQRWINH